MLEIAFCLAFHFFFGKIIMRIQVRFMDFSDIKHGPWWSPHHAQDLFCARFKRARSQTEIISISYEWKSPPDESHVNFTDHHRRYADEKKRSAGKDRHRSRQQMMISSPPNQKSKWFFLTFPVVGNYDVERERDVRSRAICFHSRSRHDGFFFCKSSKPQKASSLMKIHPCTNADDSFYSLLRQ